MLKNSTQLQRNPGIGQRTNLGSLDWSQPGMNDPMTYLDYMNPNQLVPGLMDFINPVDLGANKIYVYGNTTPVSSAYWGSVYHPNGKIYMIPYSATEVCEVDPNVGDAIFFGAAGSGSTKWRGGFLGKDGLIYCIPSITTPIGIINPYTKTIDTSSFTNVLEGNYNGGCYGPDGLFYLTPGTSSTTSVQWIDTANRTTGTSLILSGSGYYGGAIMAPNGRIWFIPRDDDNCVVYDVWKKSYELVAMPTNGFASFGYKGGVLAPNGCIYCAPGSADRVLEINTHTKKGRLIGSYVNGGTLAYTQAIYAPDGFIYMIPDSAANILKVDWIRGTTEEIPAMSGSSKWGPGCIDKNGKFWSSTYSGDSILCMDFQQLLDQRTMLCQPLN